MCGHVCSVVSQPLCQYLYWDRCVLLLIGSKKKKKGLSNLSQCCCLDPLIIPLSSIMEQAFICESVTESQRTYWITHVLIADTRIKLHALCNCDQRDACSASPSVCVVKMNPLCVPIKYTAVSQHYLPFGFILAYKVLVRLTLWLIFECPLTRECEQNEKIILLGFGRPNFLSSCPLCSPRYSPDWNKNGC